jgi:hypothetical protein
VDDATWSSPWYQERSSELLVEKKLEGTPDGTFVIHDSLSSKAFMLSYSYFGLIKNAGIQNTKQGVFVHGCPEATFKTLAMLVDYYVNKWSDEDIYTLPCRLLVTSFKAAEEAFFEIEMEDGPADSTAALLYATETRSILKGPTDFSRSRKRKGKQKKVTWDELELAAIEKDLEPRRGIRKRIDAEAARAAYLMLDLHPVEAMDLLASAAVGKFVIYSGIDGDPNTLRISYVDEKGQTAHTVISNYKRGMKLAGSTTLFRSLSKLVRYFGSANNERPRMLCGFKDDQLSAATWLHPTMNRMDATEQLSHAPTGSFVVRGSNKAASKKGGVEEGGYALTYKHEGLVHHTQIGRTEAGVQVAGSTKVFGTVFELVRFYVSCADADLRCQLHLPKYGVEVRPAWMRTGMPKDDALQSLHGRSDGAFVVRSRDIGGKDGGVKGREMLALSYLTGGLVRHEPIVDRPAQSPQAVAMMLTTEYALELFSDAWFPTVELLVKRYSAPGSGLQCPLRSRGSSNVASRNRGLLLARKPTGEQPGSTPRRGITGGGGKSTLEVRSQTNPIQSSSLAATLARDTSNLHRPSSSWGGGASGAACPAAALGSEYMDKGAKAAPWQRFGMPKKAALMALDRNKDGSFVLRDNAAVFATISISTDGKLYNAHIVDNGSGIKLKLSSAVFKSMSAFVAFYSNPKQTELPQHLVL